MSEQNYVILSDGEKYPVESLIDINAMQQIPGCSCGISLNKETYNVSANTEKGQAIKTSTITSEATIEQLQLYLEMLETPKEPEKLKREPLWCHKIFYLLYLWLDDSVGLFMTLWAGLCVVVGLIASAFDTELIGVWLFVSMLVLVGLSYLVVYSVCSYIPKKKAYWLDMYNCKLVPCTVRSVYTPDDSDPELYVRMQEDYTYADKYVKLSSLVFADEEIAMWGRYFDAYKRYLDIWNTTTLQMYYPKYADDKLFLQFMQSKAIYKDGKLYQAYELMHKYIRYLKELQADGVRQKNIINDLQAELEIVKSGTYSEADIVKKKKKRNTKTATYVK